MINVKYYFDICYIFGVYFDKDFWENFIYLEKGEMFGEFNFGFIVVLIFEVFENFKFNVNND